MLALFSVLGGLSALLLLLVPVGRINLTLPDEVIFGVSCGSNMKPHLILNQDHPCYPVSNTSDIETHFNLQSCGFSCPAILEDKYVKAISETKEYEVQILDIEKNDTLSYTYMLPEENMSMPASVTTRRNHMKLSNDIHYLTSIRKLSKNIYYFPTKNFLNFSCDVGKIDYSDCIIGSLDQILGFNRRSTSRSRMGISPIPIEHEDKLEQRQLYKMTWIESKVYNNLQCIDSQTFSKKHISVTIPINSTDNKVKHLDLGSCSTKCIGTVKRSEVCTNSKEVVEVDMKVTFWSYLCIRVFVGIVSGTSFAMFEGAVIAILREHKADYGLQRIYATIGGMISSPISGLLIDFASSGKSYTDYRPIFFLYAGLKVISGVLMLFINLEFKKAAESVVTDVLNVLKKTELIALFISCLVLGKIN